MGGLREVVHTHSHFVCNLQSPDSQILKVNSQIITINSQNIDEDFESLHQSGSTSRTFD